VDVVEAVLTEPGFPARRLVLELTENTLLLADTPTLARLQELRNQGIGLAVDGFGAGYAAISYLRDLPVTIVKIDSSFIADIDHDEKARAIADAIVRLGTAFRLTVVAKGVRTEDHAAALRDMDCAQAQGF
jgi:EAL domain-containing protein (putative c-di-GMP-specific phosphodiesterase class I)